MTNLDTPVDADAAERKRTYMRAYVEANKERYRAQYKAYHAANKEQRNARRRARRAANREKERATSKAWREANKEQHRAMRKAWLAANPEKARVYRNAWASLRRATLLNATPPWADLAEIRKIYETAAMFGMHVDHIHPLKGKNFCGLHVPWNLQILTPKQNWRKGNKLLERSS